MRNYYGPLRGRSTAAAGGGGGGGAGSVTINDYAYSDFQVDPGNASASFSLSSGGVASGTGGVSYNWLISGAASAYEVMADNVTGSFSSGTINTWLPLSSTRTWTRTRTLPGYSSAIARFRIRRASDGIVLATATIQVEAEVEIGGGGGGA